MCTLYSLGVPQYHSTQVENLHTLCILRGYVPLKTMESQCAPMGTHIASRHAVTEPLDPEQEPPASSTELLNPEQGPPTGSTANEVGTNTSEGKADEEGADVDHLATLDQTRAAILGACDGIVTTRALVTVIAAANASQHQLLLSAVASMASGAALLC